MFDQQRQLAEGLQRSLLTAPVHDEHRIVVVASKGGHSDHPDWYKNALANPDVSVTVDGVDEPVHARPATPEERSELWPQVVRTRPKPAPWPKPLTSTASESTEQ